MLTTGIFSGPCLYRTLFTYRYFLAVRCWPRLVGFRFSSAAAAPVCRQTLSCALHVVDTGPGACSAAASVAPALPSVDIVVMLVLDVALLAAFDACKKWVLPSPFIPFELLASSTLLGVSLLLFIFRVAFFSWSSYFTSHMQVVYHASISRFSSNSTIFEAIHLAVLILGGWSALRTGACHSTTSVKASSSIYALKVPAWAAL